MAKGNRGGRPPKPAHLHVLDGTHRQDRHGSKDDALAEMREAKQSPAPSAPDWLTELGKQEWQRMAPRLHALGLLAEKDLVAFACYCRAYARVQEAEQLVAEEGMSYKTAAGAIVQHPGIGMANAAAKQVRDFIYEFGLSPVAWARLRAGREDERSDDLDSFLDGGSDAGSGAE